jgi:hypothetical protein
MFHLSASEITDSYIKEYIRISIENNLINIDIELIKRQLLILRIELKGIYTSLSNKEEIRHLIQRYTNVFRDLLVERDKIPVSLVIRIPNTPFFFPAVNTPVSRYRYEDTYRYEYT